MQRRELVIIGFVVLAGSMMSAAGLYFLSVKRVVQVVDARTWPEVPCVIVSSKVVSRSGEGAGYGIDVTYEFEVVGKRYRYSRYDFFESREKTERKKQTL